MHSAAGLGAAGWLRERPFRAPHHTISPQGLVGGGAAPLPGEITLAHRGVLFLDELAEFARAALDALRQPLEDGTVEIMRGQRTLDVPGERDGRRRLQPLPVRAAGGPLPCTAAERGRYLRRLSGPLLDRHRPGLPGGPVRAAGAGRRRAPAREPSHAVGERRVAARERQRARLAGSGALCNGDMDGRLTRRAGAARRPPSAAGLLGARERLELSGRGHDRVLRVARTIADLDGRERVGGGRPRRGALATGSTARPAGRVSACDPACAVPGRSRLSLAWRRIAGLLDRPRPALRGLLALPEDELVAAAAGRGEEARAASGSTRFDAAAERAPRPSAGVARVCRHRRPTRRCWPSWRPARGAVRDGAPEAPRGLRAEPAVAIVGTRRPVARTAWRWPTRSGRGLGRPGCTVVSGLALGIDAAAHRGCLDGGGAAPWRCSRAGRTSPTRAGTARLHGRCASAASCSPSCRPARRPFRWSFPARNRIMAGLARMTVVVEAADPSGSLITADFARDLGRTVAAVPGHVTSRWRAGTNGLLRDGAVPVTGAEDVLDELFGVGVRPAPAARERVPGARRRRAAGACSTRPRRARLDGIVAAHRLRRRRGPRGARPARGGRALVRGAAGRVGAGRDRRRVATTHPAARAARLSSRPGDPRRHPPRGC